VTNGKPQLTGGRSRQKLAEGQQLSKAVFIEPAQTLHKMVAKIADMGGRAPKADTTEQQKLYENLSHQGETLI
jgi:hypothetical protein